MSSALFIQLTVASFVCLEAQTRVHTRFEFRLLDYRQWGRRWGEDRLLSFSCVVSVWSHCGAVGERLLVELRHCSQLVIFIALCRQQGILVDGCICNAREWLSSDPYPVGDTHVQGLTDTTHPRVWVNQSTPCTETLNLPLHAPILRQRQHLKYTRISPAYFVMKRVANVQRLSLDPTWQR